MNRFAFTLGLYRDYLANYLKTKLSYRADFWIEVLSDLLFNGLNLVFIFIVFMHTPSLGGWSEAEVVFVYGYFMLASGLFSTFFSAWNFSERYIVKGEMDRVLTRPAHSLVQVMLENMDPPALFGGLVGLAILISSWTTLGLPLHWYDPLVLIVMVLGSCFIYMGIYTAMAAISFYSDAPTGIGPLIYNIQNYGRYPVEIYNKAIKFLLTWLLPFAFVGVYPASFFLGRLEEWWMPWLTPIVGLVFLTIGISFWNYGVKRYRGAGS
ncbi:ABC-2 family transporter protein [Cohnella sp. LGH]|uniref:ABC transporter permease n=1 Tax=Cohnella sp. LGH TaxID=1619153 RepID=UPI001ADBBE2E|nr:ABC-2 family transporter protein [Cohnella sp. LGH]QTH40963.1 ABC-2 family transporter protein [Cohnella sp. LGH]